jgi:hypothetical protein
MNELRNATTEFKVNYRRFVEKNEKFITIEDQVNEVIQIAEAENDTRLSAHIFRKGINSTLSLSGRKRQMSKDKWITKVCEFVTKLYPIARLSLRLTSAIADVFIMFECPDPRGPTSSL